MQAKMINFTLLAKRQQNLGNMLKMTKNLSCVFTQSGPIVVIQIRI
jgi:hypothetical protein